MIATMNARDAVSGALGECFITVNGNRYNFMTATKVTATYKKNKTAIPILGKTMKGHKTNGGEGTGNAEFHYNSSVFRKMMIEYIKTGKDVYFDMQITNDDPTSNAGRQTTMLYDCNIDSIVMAQLDASTEDLTESVDFTFDGCDLPEEFDLLDGML